MKIHTFGLIIFFAVSLAGCSDVARGESSDDSTVTSQTPQSPEEIAAQQALLQPMDQVARKHMNLNTGWSALSSDEKQPFLDFHGGNESKAENHYKGMLEQHREMAQQGY